MRCFVAGMVRFSIASGAYLSEYGTPYSFLYVLESHGQITLHHTILISFQINLTYTHTVNDLLNARASI